MARKAIPSRIRRLLAERYGCEPEGKAIAECYWCRKEAAIYRIRGWAVFEHHIDHFIPMARGGTDDLANLVLACSVCNKSRGSKLPEEFLAQRAAA